MEDFELLLFSWAQMRALLLVMPTDDYRKQLHLIENQLMADYQIDLIQLVGRTLEEYAVGYRKNGENQMIRFDSEEVESIYEA